MSEVFVKEDRIYIEARSKGIDPQLTVTEANVQQTVEVVSRGPIGPQGPVGPQGPPGVGGILVDDATKLDGSVVYYDAASESYKADAEWRLDTLTDGGNF